MTDPAPGRLPHTVTPNRYDLEIDLDIDAATFTGRVRIAVDVAEATDRVLLNARDLEIDRATIERDGTTVECTPTLFPVTEHLALDVDTALAPGPAVLDLEFRGRLHDDLVGFYRSTFTADDGLKQTIAATQFEAPHARRAFPCFDEPDFKAVFGVTLVVDDALVALSNGAEISRDAIGNGRARVRFADTISMSTYLVAFVVGPLEITERTPVGAIPIRMAHVPGRSHLTAYALDVAAFAVDYFADYYGIPYPGDKLDLVALPDFAFGAMENLGCVTFRETLLLVDPAQVTQAEQVQSAYTIVHEIAHMWFGDLVTMKWWNGIWLNEAFATFMENAGVDAYRPDWKVWDDFAVRRAAALDIDALTTTRPVEYEVRTPEDADGMFDVLTYQKGGSVVRMLEQWLGADAFREGVRLYLDRYQLANTETTDLWDAIEEATGRPVRRIMDSWIFQRGFPLVSVTLDDERNTLVLEQQRCMLGDATDDAGTRWSVPVLLRASRDGDGDAHTESVLLEAERLEVSLDGAAEFVVANAGGQGFYRTAYQGAAASAVQQAVDGPLERFALVDDTWASVVRGDAAAADFFTLVQSFGDERELLVWRVLLARLRDLSRLVDGDALDAFLASVAALVAPALDRLGWEVDASESVRDGELRGLLIDTLGGLVGDDAAEQRCRTLLAQSLDAPGTVDADIVGACVQVVASAGTAADFDHFAAQFEHANTPQEQLRYLFALAAFPGAGEFARMLDLVASDRVRSQNAPFVFQRAFRNRTHGRTAWEFVSARWSELQARFPATLMPRMLEGIAWLVDDASTADVPAFLAAHPVPEGERTIAQHLERQRVHRALWEREHERFGESVRAYRAAARD